MDERRFRALYEEYHTDLLNFIIYCIKDREPAEDVLQEVFLEAFRKWEILKEHPEPRGFLFRIAKYKIQKYYEQKQRRMRIENRYSNEKYIGEEYIPDEIEKLNLSMTLQSFLKPEELQLLDEYLLCGYTSKEIAVTHHKSDTAIRMSYSRLMKKIMKYWMEE